MNNTLDSTPVIHRDSILHQSYLGEVETGEGILCLTRIDVAAEADEPRSLYVVAGGACNAGLLPSFARAFDPDYESIDECIQELVADVEAHERGDNPSGELLTWHGSMVI